jgi:hypothetical protein
VRELWAGDFFDGDFEGTFVVDCFHVVTHLVCREEELMRREVGFLWSSEKVSYKPIRIFQTTACQLLSRFISPGPRHHLLSPPVKGPSIAGKHKLHVLGIIVNHQGLDHGHEYDDVSCPELVG